MIELLAGIFLLGFCVFFHELGHFLAGKLVGVRPKIFSIGYGKGRITKVIGDTTYQITAIPLGGYVQFYGDDITQKPDTIEKGDFFSVSPWKRIIIAAGGPLFSIALGLIVIFILLTAGWQPISNEIQIIKSPIGSEKKYPAEEYLKNGDIVTSVNGHTVQSFEEINYHIALAPTDNISINIERDKQPLHFNLKAIHSSVNGIPQIGIQPSGAHFLIVEKSKEPFKKGDHLVAINNTMIDKFTDLKEITNQFAGKSFKVTVIRKENSLLGVNNGIAQKLVLDVPVKKVEMIAFHNIMRSNSNTIVAPLIEFTQEDIQILSRFTLGGETYNNWKDFQTAIKYHVKGNKTPSISFYLDKDKLEATIQFGYKGMMGILLNEGIEPKKANLPSDFLSILKRTYQQTIFAAESSILGLYRMIQGRLSFRENVSGPVKIVDYARQSVTAGWDVYWFLLANITIILGIMNLLPIPVLDGGHILFYLIEGVYKPVSTKIISLSIRLGMVLLFTFGISVLFIDIWDVIIKRILN